MNIGFPVLRLCRSPLRPREAILIAPSLARQNGENPKLRISGVL
jgi:hypothetical protein